MLLVRLWLLLAHEVACGRGILDGMEALLVANDDIAIYGA